MDSPSLNWSRCQPLVYIFSQIAPVSYFVLELEIMSQMDKLRRMKAYIYRDPGRDGGQRVLTDFFPVKKRRRYTTACDHCKQFFETDCHLDEHIRRDKCTYHGGNVWVSLINLPEPALLCILSFLSIEELTNALQADQRLLMVHGIRGLWTFKVNLLKSQSPPPCHWIKRNLLSLRNLDFYIRFRFRGRLKWTTGMRRKNTFIRRWSTSIRFNKTVGRIIWSERAVRRRCFCILQL